MKSTFTGCKILTLLIVFSICTPKESDAQITVVDNQTAAALAQQLVGAGVIMMNPTLTCQGVANGIFHGTSNLGIDSGIVLTNGSASEVAGPPSDADDPMWGPDNINNTPGDPDLNTVIPGFSTDDACVLEFDFVPSGDTVKFDYVFGSTEYQEYSCSPFNDVFGFFISGPGYSTPYNMAIIPNTDIPICVNSTTNPDAVMFPPFSLNDCTNMGTGSPFSQYYIDNVDGNTIAYGGFTTLFTAQAAVIPCDTFHLKLAIADGFVDFNDYSLDSGVFLKAGSLNSVGIVITDSTGGGQQDDEAHAVRGCIPGRFRFERPSPIPQPLTVHYTVEGTAINGVDYEQIADSIIIPGNETIADLVINPLLVSQATGPRSVVLTIYSPYLCGNGEPNVIARDTLMIFDSLYASPAIVPEGICPGDSVLLTEELVNGLSIHWTPTGVATTPNATSTWVHPTATTMFTATVTQNGAPATCPPVKRYYNVHVDPIPKIVMPSDNVTFCLTDSVDLPLDVLPEDYEYTYKWMPATGLRSDTIGYNRFYAPLGDYNFTITAYSPLGCASSKDLTVHVIPPFEFTNLSPDTTINYGDQIQLHADGAQLYEWGPPRWMLYPNEADPYVSPLETTTYTVVGINKFGCRDTADVKVTVLYVPKDMVPSAFSPNGDGLNDVFEIKNLGEERILQFAVFNRYGQQVFSTASPDKGWDGTFNDKACAADVYNYIIKLSSPNGYVRTIKGDVTLVR